MRPIGDSTSNLTGNGAFSAVARVRRPLAAPPILPAAQAGRRAADPQGVVLHPRLVRRCDRLRSLWRAFAAAPSRDRRLAAVAVVGVPLVALALLALGFGPVWRACRAAAGAGRPAPEGCRAARVRRIDAVVTRAAAHVPGSRCLPRALVTWVLLAREGFEPALRIGVRRAGRGIEAHGWVECQGIALGVSAAEGFAAFVPRVASDPTRRRPRRHAQPRPAG